MVMSVAEIKQRILAGEDIFTEFKQRDRPDALTKKDMVRNLVALANTAATGPTMPRALFIGVSDSGRPTGYTPFQEFRSTNDLVAYVQDTTLPPLIVEATEHVIDGNSVLVIEIPDSTDTESSPTCTNEGLYVHRLMSRTARGGPMVVALEPHNLWSRFKNPAQIDWASLRPAHLDLEDLDPLEFDRFRRLCSIGQGDKNLANLSDKAIAEVLGVCDPYGNLSIGAALLFGSATTLARLVPNHEIQLQILDGTRVVRNKRIVAPLFNAAEQIWNFFYPYIKEEELHLGMLRIPIPNLPETVLREAVCNALVHRSYTALGPTTIALHSDEFFTSSPGGFPGGISLANILSASNPRSRILAEAFKRAGLVERTGRGVQRMVSEALSLGLAEPSFEASTEDLVQFSYYISHSDKSFIAFVKKWDSNHQALPLTQLRILRYLWQERAASSSHMKTALALTQASLSNALKDLLSLGIIEKSGKGAATIYSVAASLTSHTHPRLTPESAREKILSHAFDKGSITRTQAEKLTGLSSQQAYRTLTKLVDEGLLIKVGTTRNTSYQVKEGLSAGTF